MCRLSWNIRASFIALLVLITCLASAQSLTSVTVSPNSVTGGGITTGTVKLSGRAGNGGVVVALASGSPAAITPDSITVLPGDTSANFQINTFAVEQQTIVKIRGSLNGKTTAGQFIVLPAALIALIVTPSTVPGGTNATGQVFISGPAPSTGATIYLSSSSSVASVPASVVIPSGMDTTIFTINTKPVALSTSATISARWGDQTKTAKLTVVPSVLGSFTLNPNPVIGGNNSTGTVTLTGSAPPGGYTLSVFSSKTSVAQVPSSVSISAGSSTVSFTVTTSQVLSNDSSLISVSIKGGSGLSQTLYVLNLGLNGLSLNPTTVVGGNSSTGTVTLSQPAPSSGTVVSLSSDSNSATVPSTVTVPSGASSASFTVNTVGVASTQSANIKASLGSASYSAPLTITAPTLSGLAFSPSTVAGGNSSLGTLTLSSPAPSGGLSVSLSSSNSAVTVPATLTIPAGSSSATFTATTVPVSSNVSSTVTASVNGASTTATLNVTAPSVVNLVLNPGVVVGGNPSTGVVSLSSAAPASFVVKLSSSKNEASVPASVTIPAGATSATFSVSTVTVSSQVIATIGASANGTAATASLTVNPSGLQSLTLSPSTVIGGKTSTGTLTLSSPAAQGYTATLQSTNQNAFLPSTVTFNTGATSASFTIYTAVVGSNQTSTISASANGSTVSAVLTITNGQSGGKGLDPSSPWPKFHGDIRSTGYSPNVVSGPDWTTAIGSPVMSSPAIGKDGTVFVGANNGYVYSLNPGTGTINWQTKTGARVVSSPAIGSNGTIFVGSADTYLYAINSSNGNVVWKAKTGGAVTSSPALGADGNVYFGSFDGYVYSLKQTDGSLVWKSKTGGAIESSPNIGSDGTLYVGSDDFNVYAFNTVTGTVSWSYTTGDMVQSSPAISNGSLFVGSSDGCLYSLNATNGSLIWSFQTGWSVHSSPAIDANGYIYFGSDDAYVYCLNSVTGSQVWSYGTGDAVQSSPAIDPSGFVYIGSQDGYLYDFVGQTGGFIGALPMGPAFSSASVGKQNNIFVGSDAANQSMLLQNTLPQASGYTCWTGNLHWYLPVSVPAGISWTNAEIASEASNGHLATITTATESAFVFGLISSNDLFWQYDGGSTRWLGPWLGGYTNSAGSGNWNWITSEPFAFWGFGGGQPDNSGGNETKLCWWYSGSSYWWNDYPDYYDPNGGKTFDVVSYVLEVDGYHPSPQPSSLNDLWIIYVGANNQVIRMDPITGSKNVMFTCTSQSSNFWPQGSPDGQSIAIGADYPNVGTISIVDLNGTLKSKLPMSNTGINWSPHWSPSGQKICYFHADNSSSSVQLLEYDFKGNSTTLLETGVAGLAADYASENELVYENISGGKYTLHLLNTISHIDKVIRSFSLTYSLNAVNSFTRLAVGPSTDDGNGNFAGYNVGVASIDSGSYRYFGSYSYVGWSISPDNKIIYNVGNQVHVLDATTGKDIVIDPSNVYSGFGLIRK